MTTAVDTNTASALWSGESTAPLIYSILIEDLADDLLTISGPVYAELLACPGLSKDKLDVFLNGFSVRIDFDLGEDIWLEAGERYAAYAERRRRTGAEPPRRLLADFLIGAHALRGADRLMTFDQTLYRRYFPELALLVPSAN